MMSIEGEAIRTAHEMVGHFGTAARVEYRAGLLCVPLMEVIEDMMSPETRDQAGALHTKKNKSFFLPMDTFEDLESTLGRQVLPGDKIHRTTERETEVYEVIQGIPVETYNIGMMQINTVKVAP